MQCPQDEAELERVLSDPDPESIALMDRLEGPLLVLGAGGKMGPTLCQMARRAADEAGRTGLRVVAVSRFSDPTARKRLEAQGIETIAADLADPEALGTLPDAKNVIFMAGRKFGERGSESLTWLMNTVIPGNVARRFSDARMVVFSTGCVYPLRSMATGGCTEEVPPAPVGEYAASCLGRERVFEHYSRTDGLRVLLYRLNYAIDLRYGVLVDLAQQIAAGGPVRAGVSAVNIIWQGDANNRALRALELADSPPVSLNVTGPETVPVVELAKRLAHAMGKTIEIVPADSESCYLSDASCMVQHFGPPRVSLDTMIEWTAEWVGRGGQSLGKPTHFQVTDGQFLD